MKYGILGEKLPHTFSPQLHKLLGNDNYEKFEVSPEKLESFLKKRGFKGINVTMPFKRKVMEHIDYIDKIAYEIGAVNTIVNNHGFLYGYNTDYYGMEYTLDLHGFDISGKRVLILGSGGASLTAQTLCKNKGAVYAVVSRNGEMNYTNIDYDAWDFLINTTPVGMYPLNYEKPVDITRFSHLKGVFDVIYNPLKTQLVLEAEAHKIPAVGGLLMLCAQAKKASDLFYKTADDAVTVELFNTVQLQKCNIVLIGMPGSGKTTIGKKISAQYDRTFFDTDELISRRDGRQVVDIFNQEGEAYFRKLEAEVILEVSKHNGVVIATGGGSIENPKSVAALKQNGYLVHIKRSTNRLATNGRPLSSSAEELQKLYQRRMPIYESIADETINNTSKNLVIPKILRRKP